MRKEIFAVLCAVAFIVGGVTLANAANVTWTILQDASIRGAGPGDDDLIGTGDDTATGQNNGCNFDSGANCDADDPGPTGSWSFVALELRNDMLNSCFGGANAGDVCTTNTECGGSPCLSCPQNDGTGDPWDTWSYMGAIPGESNGNGTMVARQCDGGASWTAIRLGSTESISQGTGATCINQVGGGAWNNCGVGAFSSSADIEFKLACNPLIGAGNIDNLTLNGRVYDATAEITTAVCDYSLPELNAIRTVATGQGATALLVMCGSTSIPNDETTTAVCLRGASVWDVVVAKTSANVANCSDPCTTGGTCAGGVAEAAE